MQSTAPVKSRATTANPEVGLVVPAQVYPGERVSGTVVANPAEYEGMAGVAVTRVAVPLEAAGEASTLAGWTVEDTRAKSRNGPTGRSCFTVPRDGSGINITFQQTGDSAHSVSKLINFAPSSSKREKTPRSFEAAALCMKGQLCTVRGPFSGDSSKTFAAFEDRPATVVAETPNTAYIRIPDLTEAGARPLFLAEGSKVVGLPVAVGEFSLYNGEKELQKGQSFNDLPARGWSKRYSGRVAWRPGNFPATNLEEARKLIPGFQLPRRRSRGAREAGSAGKGRVKGKTRGGREKRWIDSAGRQEHDS